MINLRQVLTGDPIRLRYIKRFSVCPRVHEESVAEHSYYVSFIAMMIAEDIRSQGVHKIDVGTLLCRALIHDLDEVFSGDFIRMFKHSSAVLKEAIDDTSNAMMGKFTSSYTAGKNLMKYWRESKADDIEGKILAYADFLSVVSYVWQEINAGNVIMFEHLDELCKFCNSFNADRYAFLCDYQIEARELLREMVAQKRRLTCKKK